MTVMPTDAVVAAKRRVGCVCRGQTLLKNVAEKVPAVP